MFCQPKLPPAMLRQDTNDAGRKDKQNSMFDRSRRQGFVVHESGKFKVDTFHWYKLNSNFEFPAIDDARTSFPLEFVLERLD